MWFPEYLNSENSKYDALTSFLILRWEELFSHKTPDTYQPPIMSLPSLFQEIIDLSEEAKKQAIWTPYLNNAFAELKHVVTKDDIFNSKCGELSNIVTSNITDIKTLNLIGKIGVEKTQNYRDWIFESIDFELSKSNPSKQKLNENLTKIATTFVRLDLDKEIHKNTQLYNQDTFAQTPSDFIINLKTHTSKNEKEWRCIYVIKSNIDGDINDIQALFNNTEFKILTNAQKPTVGINWIKFKETLDNIKNHLTITTIVMSTHPKDALDRGLARLNQLINMANFFHRSNNIIIHPSMYSDEISGANMKSEQYFYDKNEFKNRTLQPSKNSNERAVDAYLKNNNIAFENIFRSLERRSAAYQTTDIGMQYTHIWSALEALVIDRPEKNIFDKVANGTLHIIVGARCKKLIKYLSYNMYQKKLFCESFKVHLPNSSESYIDPGDILRLVCQSELIEGKKTNSFLGEQLVPCIKMHPLLINRIHTTWQSFHDVEKIAREIEFSYKRTGWQLKRIYYVRNKIVHQGFEDKNTSYLLKNLEYYYTAVLKRLLHDLKINANWSVFDVLEYRRLSWSNTLKNLKSQNLTNLTTQSFMPDETNELALHPLWKT